MFLWHLLSLEVKHALTPMKSELLCHHSDLCLAAHYVYSTWMRKLPQLYRIWCGIMISRTKSTHQIWSSHPVCKKRNKWTLKIQTLITSLDSTLDVGIDCIVQKCKEVQTCFDLHTQSLSLAKTQKSAVVVSKKVGFGGISQKTKKVKPHQKERKTKKSVYCDGKFDNKGGKIREKARTQHREFLSFLQDGNVGFIILNI